MQDEITASAVTETPDGKPAAGDRRSLAAGFEWFSSLIVALVIVAVVFTFLFRIVGVDGKSMQNTLMDGDRLILISRFYTLERGDVVVINRDGEKPLIKRVIAVAGDTIDIDPKSGAVILNGEPQQEPYIRDGYTSIQSFEGPFTVPEGHIFAMGDNRLESKDSRILGAFPVEEVIGKAVYRILPFNAAGRI